MKLVAVLCTACLLVGCGSDDEAPTFDPAKKLTELDTASLKAFCDWALSAVGGADTGYTCKDAQGKETGLSVDTANGCPNAKVPECTGTVVQTCFENLKADPCLIHTEDQCKPFLQCATASGVVEELGFILTYSQDPPDNTISAP